MKNIELKEEQFYDFVELKSEIERNKYGLSLEEIYDYFKTAQITVSVSDIEEFLSGKAKEDNVDMNPEIYPLPKMISQWGKDTIEKNMAGLTAQLRAIKYTYNGYDLKYFTDYADAIREKGLIFCEVALQILSGEYEKALINLPEDALNIQDNMIDGDSILRLAEVIISCYVIMKEKIDKGNNLETYLTRNVPNMDKRNGCYMDAWDMFYEYELYPSDNLQDIDAFEDFSEDGYLALSLKQKEKERERMERNIAGFTRMMLEDEEIGQIKVLVNKKNY